MCHFEFRLLEFLTTGLEKVQYNLRGITAHWAKDSKFDEIYDMDDGLERDYKLGMVNQADYATYEYLESLANLIKME